MTMTMTVLATLLLTSATLVAPAHAGEHEHGDATVAQSYIRELLATQASYGQKRGPAFFSQLAKGQHPRATVVTCSDSRVHTNMLDETPEGDLFVIRNIGNQVATAKGSIEYGVNHLASSLLLIIGHSSCGAIKAASGDYASLEPAIVKELDTIKISKGGASIDGVTSNVNSQVAAAVEDFGDKIKGGRLLVVGAVYDFNNDMKNGAGKLNVINVNGETDAAKIKDLMAGATEKKPAGH
jgi:carbonic anhydrase